MKTDRRQFLHTVTLGGAAISGLLPGLLARANAAPKDSRIDLSYLVKGLNHLARVHLRKGSMSGHLGAAMIGGYFFRQEHPNLDDEVYKGVEADLDYIVGSPTDQSRDENGFTRAEMMASFPKEKPDETLIDGIAEALEAGIRKPRQSGHNVIFAASAIRALKSYPEFSTPSIIDGIRKYILRFKNEHPGNGHYGKERGRVRNYPLGEEEAMFPLYGNFDDMAEAVIDAVAEERLDYRRSGYGGLQHITNHAAGLVDLARYGYRDLAIKGLASHHLHMRLWRTLPNVADVLGRKTPGTHHPCSLSITHRIAKLAVAGKTTLSM